MSAQLPTAPTVNFHCLSVDCNMDFMLASWQVLCLMFWIDNYTVSESTRCVCLMRARLWLANGRIEYFCSMLLLTLWTAHSCRLCAVHDNEFRLYSHPGHNALWPHSSRLEAVGEQTDMNPNPKPTEGHIKCCHHVVISKVTLARVPFVRVSVCPFVSLLGISIPC